MTLTSFLFITLQSTKVNKHTIFIDLRVNSIIELQSERKTIDLILAKKFYNLECSRLNRMDRLLVLPERHLL